MNNMRISNITNLGAMTRTGSGGGAGAGSAPAAPAAPAKPPKSIRPTSTGSTAQSRSGATLVPAATEVKPSASTKVVKPSASSMQSMTSDVVKAAAKEAQVTLRQQSGDTSFTTAMAVAEAQAKTAAAVEKAAALRAQLVLAQETKQAVITPTSVTATPNSTTSMAEYGTQDWYSQGGSSGSALMPTNYAPPTSSGGGGGDGGGAAELRDSVKTSDTKMTEADSGMKSSAAVPSHDSTMSRWLKYGGAALAAGAVGYIAYKRLKKN